MSHKPASWNEYLTSFDTENIWKQLHRIVGQHKLSRHSNITDNLVEQGNFNKYVDLTQELFVKLLEKDRFTHYINAGMEDKEIELEISQIELTNLLTSDIRKRYPESYRISLRTLQLLKNSPIFKKINIKANQRVTDQLYGLHKWDIEVEVKSLQHQALQMEFVGNVTRNLRHSGCAGDSQIIISNPDLEGLMRVIFETLQSPLTVKQIRQYVISRLTILDINLSPIESKSIDDELPEVELVDTRNTPYEDLAEKCVVVEMQEKVSKFINQVYKKVNDKPKQFTLVINILKLYYVNSDNLSQLDVSKMLGVSDSTVSGYRRIIENELQSLGFSDIEQARKFQKELSANLQRL